MNNDIQSKQFQQFYKALKKGSWTGKDKTLEEALVGNIRFEQHKETDDAGKIVERIKVVKAKTAEEKETFAKHNTANTSNVVEMIQKYMEQQLKANVNKLYRMKEEADKILDAELDKITIQYGTKINKNIPTNLKADIVKAANASKQSVKDVAGKMTVGKTGKTYNEAEEYSKFLREYLEDADIIFSTKDEIKKMLLELYDDSQIYLGDEFEAEIENVKKEKVSNEKVLQIVNEKMKSYNGKKKDKNKYKNKLMNETTASENRRVEEDYNSKLSSAKEQAFEKYHGDILEAAHTYYLTEEAAFTAAKSQIIQSVADGKSKAPTDIKFEDYSEKIAKTKQGITELELELSKAVDIIVEKQLDDTNSVFASVGAEFRNLAEKMKTGSITDKDKKKIQKEIELADKKKKDDIKKLDNTYRAEQRSAAGIGRKSKQTMEAERLALENKKKPYDDLSSRYADPSVLESSDLITQKGKIKMEVAKKLFGDSKMTQKDERISGKEKVEQIKKDAEIYKKLQEKPFTDEDQTALDKVNENLSLLEQIEKTIREGDYETVKAYNEQSKAIIELLTNYEKINTDIAEKKNELSEVTTKQDEANTLVNATQAPENIAKQEEKVSSIMATKNAAEGNVLGLGEHIGQMMKHFGSYMLRLRLVQRGINDIIDTIGEFQKIDDEAFQLGMVSDMNINSIKRYRNEVLMLATNYRTTAEEIINTQSEIIKTGRTFDQAKQQVNASLILSKATFESLGDAGALLNKMMLGLEMNGDKSYETMNKLYNVIQATPQTLAGLDAAMRQSGSAFSGLIDTISYSGSQLDDYKDGLAEAQMSLLGLVALQGKTPMMAGTAIKTLIDKMRGPTDKALRNVNAELSLKKATDSNGNAITMKTIQNLTETDFTKAIELLSKLHKDGILSYQSIQDLFGPRNAATISKLLNQVNGDLESVNEELLKRRDVLKDSEKLDSSWSQEMEELKNSFRALKGVANDFGDSLKPAVKVLRQGVSGIADWAGNTDIGKSTVQTISAGMTLGSIAKNGYYSLLAGSQAAKGNGAAMMGLGDDQRDIAQTAFAVNALRGQIRGLSESAEKAGGLTELFSKSVKNLGTGIKGLILSPITWWVAGIAAAVAILGALYIRHKRLEGEINQSLINLEANSEKSKAALASLDESFAGLGESLASITPTMFAASNGMNLLEDATKSLLDSLIEYTNKISGLNLELVKQGKRKEAEAVLKNDKSSDSDRKRAEMTIKTLNETDFGSLSKDELVKGSDFKKNALELLMSDYEKLYESYNRTRNVLTGEKLGSVEEAIIAFQNGASDSREKFSKAVQLVHNDGYSDNTGADLALAIEVKSELYSSILDASAQYETSLVDAFNRDIGMMKDITNKITDITSGHQKNVLTKNNSKLLDKTILNMTKYDKKLAAVIDEKYKNNIFQTMEYEDAMEILNQQVLLKEARDMNKRNRNRYNSINGVAKDSKTKIALKGNVFTAITDTETKLKADNLNVDNDTLTTIFTGNKKEAADALESIKNDKSKKIIKDKLEAYKKSQFGLDKETNRQVKSGFEIEKYIDKIKGDPNTIYKKLSNLAQNDSNGNLVFSLLVELAEKDINKYNEVMKLFSEKVEGNAKKTFNAMESRLLSVIGAMQFQKTEEPVLEAAIQFQEIINKMIRSGADKIKRIEASLGIIEGQINSSGEYASFSNIAKAASKRMDLSTAQNKQEYVENMVKQITPEEYADNNGLIMAYNSAMGRMNTLQRINTTDATEMGKFSNWLFDKNNVGFLNKAQKEFAAVYEKNAKEVMSKASKLTPEEIKLGYTIKKNKDGNFIKDKNGNFIKNEEIDAKILAEATRQRGGIDKYFGDLGINESDITKAILSVTDEANKRAAMAALGESKYIKDSDIAAIPNFIGEIYNIKGKIDESAYKYNKVYETDVTKDIKYGGRGSKNPYSPNSTAKTDVDRLKEINDEVAKINAKTQEDINTKANKDLLEKLAKEKSQIEEKIKIQNSINQIELDELNRIKQFYIELQKASYDFNRSIGYGVQFADMQKVSAALKDKRDAEITISENRDKILKDENVGSVKYDTTDQKYKVYDKNGIVMNDNIHQEEVENLTKAENKRQKSLIDINSYKNYRNEAVRDEIGIETKIREMDQYIDTNSDAGKHKKKQAQRELDIEKANLFETLFEDINKSLSDLPSVQLMMLENQAQMKKNELEIWKTQEDSAKKTLEIGKLKAEIETKEIEIAKHKLEIEKQIIEKEKNIFELQNQRYEMLGIHKYSPQDKYLRDVSNAQQVFKLSSEELDIEERRAKLSIENTDAIRELTTALLRNIITESGDSTEYNLYKYLRDAKKNAENNGKDLSPGHAATLAFIENEDYKRVYQAEENAKNTTKIDTTDTEKLRVLKQVEAIEQYITSLYKARMDYIDNMSKKYEGIVTGATALITGDKSKIKYEKPDLTKSIFTTYGAAKELFNRDKIDFTDTDRETIKDDKKWNNLMTSKGNEDYYELSKMTQEQFEEWLKKPENKTYQDAYKNSTTPYQNLKQREVILKKKETDGFKELATQAAVQTVVGVFDVINEASVNKLKLELAGLQYEQRILEMRKSGYRTEYAKYNMDKHIQANKRKQIEKEAKIAEKEKDAQNGALFGAVGQGLLSSGEPHAMAAGAALMILQQPLGKLFDDGSAKIEKEKKLAEFNTEESFKEYGMFWDRFFKVIEKMTSYAEQKIESMTSDYNKSRNLNRRNKTIDQINDEAKIITDSVNDFEGIASATKTVKARTWYGKTKKSKVTTDWNFAMDNLDKDQILSYANMTDEQLREAMISEAKKDNPDKYVTDSKGRWHFKNDKGEWSVTDEALYDFRKNLQDASEAINYLDRMISESNLSNKEFYGNLEGFGVDKESEIKNQFNEQIASALAAGDTATAKMLTSMRDQEVQRFKDAGVTEIYYSTFSQIMYEAAEKVAKDTGNFSDAFATGIGAMIGTTFRNTIDEIMKRGITDNSYLDEWATKFYEGMKKYDGNLANFINSDGVLDLNALSETVGAGSITDKLLANKSDWDKMNNLNIYRTSSTLASQYRNAGLDEVSIGKLLESAGLKDILKDAVNEIADIFNPVGLSSAKLKMKRESFESDNGRRAEEIRRKKLLGTASAGELKELDNIENGYLKLSIEENVYNGFKSGIESAIKETSYTNIFSKFGSMIGDAISKTTLKNINLDDSAQKVADLLKAENYAEAGKEIRNTSLTALAIAKQNEETAKKLREQGLDWTEVYGTTLIPNIYQDVTNELSSQNALKNIGAKYKKSEIDLSNTMATDRYNNSEYYNELMNRKARGDFISENEVIWIEQYESSLTNITNKQNLLNSLQSSFNSMLSNKTGLDYLKQVSQSIGQTIDEMIMQKIKVDFTMESLIEKIIGGKNANKEIAELSKVYESAKSTQELIKNQMLSNGASYSLIEQMFGEDVASTIADVYSEMQNYSNTLGRISYQEEHYKKEIISVNGVLFQYDEYYRELNLKKANGIALTESEIAWMNRYTDTVKKFETNKKVVTEFYSAVGQAFNSDELLKSFSSFADSFNNMLKEKIVDGYLSNELSDDMANMISIAQNALSTGTVSDLYSAQKQMMAFSAQVQTAKNQTQGLIDMFDSNKIIDFTDKTKDITYNASSSKETVYNITQNLSVAAGAVIGDGVSLDKLAKTLAPYLSKELKKY